MNTKEFKKSLKEQFEEYFEVKVGTEEAQEIKFDKIEGFLRQADLNNFHFYAISDEGAYWCELRLVFYLIGRSYSIVFNHDYKLELSYYYFDDLFEEVEAMRQEAIKVDNNFNNFTE